MDMIKLTPGHVLRFGMYSFAKSLDVSNPSYVMGFDSGMRARQVELYDGLIDSMQSGAEDPRVEIATGLEDVCKQCPGKGNCSGDACKTHDETIAEMLGVTIGDSYSPTELNSLLLSFYARGHEAHRKV